MLAFISVDAFYTVHDSKMTIAQAIANHLVFQISRGETYTVNINGKRIVIWAEPIPF